METTPSALPRLAGFSCADQKCAVAYIEYRSSRVVGPGDGAQSRQVSREARLLVKPKPPSATPELTGFLHAWSAATLVRTGPCSSHALRQCPPLAVRAMCP